VNRLEGDGQRIFDLHAADDEVDVLPHVADVHFFAEVVQQIHVHLPRHAVQVFSGFWVRLRVKYSVGTRNKEQVG